jgi:enolase
MTKKHYNNWDQITRDLTKLNLPGNDFYVDNLDIFQKRTNNSPITKAYIIRERKKELH